MLSIFTSKIFWKFSIKIQLTKSDPKRKRGWKLPFLKPIRVLGLRLSTFIQLWKKQEIGQKFNAQIHIFCAGTCISYLLATKMAFYKWTKILPQENLLLIFICHVNGCIQIKEQQSQSDQNFFEVVIELLQEIFWFLLMIVKQ